MFKALFGVVALGAVGYGVKKLVEDEELMDEFKDKLEDTLIKTADGIDKLEEMFGLNSFTVNEDDNPQEYKILKEIMLEKKE